MFRHIYSDWNIFANFFWILRDSNYCGYGQFSGIMDRQHSKNDTALPFPHFPWRWFTLGVTWRRAAKHKPQNFRVGWGLLHDLGDTANLESTLESGFTESLQHTRLDLKRSLGARQGALSQERREAAKAVVPAGTRGLQTHLNWAAAGPNYSANYTECKWEWLLTIS